MERFPAFSLPGRREKGGRNPSCHHARTLIRKLPSAANRPYPAFPRLPAAERDLHRGELRRRQNQDVEL